MNERIIFKKAKYLRDKDIMAHVRTKENMIFNGYVREIDHKDYILFEDRFLGEIPIYFEEIILIEPYKLRRVE